MEIKHEAELVKEKWKVDEADLSTEKDKEGRTIKLKRDRGIKLKMDSLQIFRAIANDTSEIIATDQVPIAWKFGRERRYTNFHNSSSFHYNNALLVGQNLNFSYRNDLKKVHVMLAFKMTYTGVFRGASKYVSTSSHDARVEAIGALKVQDSQLMGLDVQRVHTTMHEGSSGPPEQEKAALDLLCFGLLRTWASFTGDSDVDAFSDIEQRVRQQSARLVPLQEPKAVFDAVLAVEELDTLTRRVVAALGGRIKYILEEEDGKLQRLRSRAQLDERAADEGEYMGLQIMKTMLAGANGDTSSKILAQIHTASMKRDYCN